MARQRLIIRTRCLLCGSQVDLVPDGVLKKDPQSYNTEYVITHTGYKQYIHTSCWNRMIEEQKERNSLVQA